MNDISEDTQARVPGTTIALSCFGGIVVLLSCGLMLLSVPIHALLFLCLCWAGAHARLAGNSYADVRNMMIGGISSALPAVFVFFLIGMVISSFMISGTVATLMVAGLEWLSPATFLLSGLLLCALMSIATGTSWGTVGTVGIVLMGIGEAMLIPAPLVAGVVISGATFGDKLSPVSDTTNLAAMSSGTDLFSHIRSMLYTTVPTLLIVIVILFFFTTRHSAAALSVDAEIVSQTLRDHFAVNVVVGLLPIAVMLAGACRRVAPEVCMAASTICALLLAWIYQDATLTQLITVLWENEPATTGVASVDALLGRGGMVSMSWTLMLALLALALGGILLRSGFLEVLLSRLISRISSTASLIASTIGTGVVGNAALGEAYVSIILTAQSYSPAFKRQGVPRSVLSRSVEEGATMTTGLIPWTTAGAFYAATLGVATLDYLPYAFLNYLNPLVSVLLASLGIGLLRGSREASNSRPEDSA